MSQRFKKGRVFLIIEHRRCTPFGSSGAEERQTCRLETEKDGETCPKTKASRRGLFRGLPEVDTTIVRSIKEEFSNLNFLCKINNICKIFDVRRYS